MGSVWLWVGFNLFVVALLALDLGVLHRGDRVISVHPRGNVALAVQYAPDIDVVGFGRQGKLDLGAR